ncbi:hypothetical protein [Bacillus cereus]|uniref:hypothetical protein n=1 Tax=Bacillus cereus TaxID=1396 RepID=UPI000B4A5EDC|nr:hypothetical protein [Bacillus cereus]
MSKIKLEQLPQSVQHILKVMRGEAKLEPRERIKPIDFYSNRADELFPNSPELQRIFNKQKEINKKTYRK